MQHFSMLLQIFLSKQQYRILLFKHLILILLFIYLLIKLVDFIMIDLLLVAYLHLEVLVQLIALGLLNFFLRPKMPELVDQLIVLHQDPVKPAPQIFLLLLIIQHHRFKFLDFFVVFLLEFTEKLLFLGLHLLLVSFFVVVVFKGEHLDVSFESNDFLFVFADLI